MRQRGSGAAARRPIRRRRVMGKGAVAAAAVAVSVALAASCRTVPGARPRPGPPAPQRPSIESYVPSPRIRIGVATDVARVAVRADAPVSVWGGLEGDAPSGPDARLACATFTAVSAGTSAGRFRVQVASLAEQEAAQQAAILARDASSLEPTVRWNEATRTFQVRVGYFATRDEARTLASQLGRSGLGSSWVVEEEAPAGSTGRIRLLETGEELAGATLYPGKPGEPLQLDGAAYRGILEVRASETGGLTVVNVVNLEDYLKGVVPNELSPLAFPQLEALKAQAVAARTYALRNRGQFASRGYDLCATPACQVYKGLSTEQALSDQAVEETRGVVARDHGAPINALYTSTCGGHTEDGGNIFEGEDEPYLRGVVCTPERSAWATIRTAAAPMTLGDADGLGRDAALLVALGILGPKLYAPAALAGPATEAELKTWTDRLLSALHREGCPVPATTAPLTRRGTFFERLVASLCWDERARRLLSPQDSAYLLQVEDRRDLAGDGEKLAAALLLQEGILSPFPDNTLRVDAGVTRAQAVGLLARVAVKAGAPGLASAEFRTAAGGEVAVKQGDTTAAYPLDPKARLFRAFEGSRVAASEVTLAAGDKVRYVLRNGWIVFLEADQSRLGAAADRTSRYFRWEVRMTPAQVAQAAARFGSVGQVKDIVPRRIGVSGRVVELAIVGSEGELLLKGLRIRTALGLRENLFVIDRERDAEGRVERFVITGKGWGHGVGLCQVGAYGMAAAGASFEEILRHYYSGVTLDKVY